MPRQIGALTLYEVEELVEALDVTKETVRAYLKTGRLKGEKFGKRWFVSEESLRDFFNPAQDQMLARAFMSAPEDDEPFTEEERKRSVQGWKECQQGSGRPWKKVREELADE
ncbi:MAG: helix-turn-helix domain-containing protein [Candidatus Eremiobacteraeota bacterium]|nr:helix-turn-helix domain-containing protein [Candidatus Eremiobacteraeota bacterium]